MIGSSVGRGSVLGSSVLGSVGVSEGIGFSVSVPKLSLVLFPQPAKSIAIAIKLIFFTFFINDIFPFSYSSVK